jgi:Gpi18-like mannosyltransferase
MPESKGLDALVRAGGLALLFGWYFALGKSQQAFVVERFGTNYPRRGWLKPLLVALGVLFAFFVVAFILAYASDAA